MKCDIEIVELFLTSPKEYFNFDLSEFWIYLRTSSTVKASKLLKFIFLFFFFYVFFFFITFLCTGVCKSLQQLSCMAFCHFNYVLPNSSLLYPQKLENKKQKKKQIIFSLTRTYGIWCDEQIYTCCFLVVRRCLHRTYEWTKIIFLCTFFSCFHVLSLSDFNRLFRTSLLDCVGFQEKAFY